MFTYLDIQQIIGETDKNYRTILDFAIEFFPQNLSYIGSRNKELSVNTNDIKRQTDLSSPKPVLKKAVIHCHGKIFDGICDFSEKTDKISDISVENAVWKLRTLIRLCPSADTFVRENVYLPSLNSRKKLALLFYIAMLASSDAFDPGMSKSQKVEEGDIKREILRYCPEAEYPSDAELTELIREECREIPKLGEYIMGYVSCGGDLRQIHAAISAGENFFDLFSIPEDQRKILHNTPFPDAEGTVNKLLDNPSVRHTLELMLFFPEYRIEKEVLREFGIDCVSALMTLNLCGILKEVSPGRIYRPYYVWLFYLDGLHGLLNRNALYYAEEFPVLPKLAELNRTDLLRTSLTRLDFTEAAPVEMLIRALLGEPFPV